MKTAVQDYIEKYITTPDIDIMSDTNREFIYQEGGYSRFFPVLPGGYQPIQAPQGTPPEQGQHALWSSVAQNLQGAARIQQGNRQLKMQETQNIIDNELGYARLDLAKQQLAQQDAQFKMENAIAKAQMASSFTDKLSKGNYPVSRMNEFISLVESSGVSQALQDVYSTDPDVSANAMGKVGVFLSNPNLVKWQAEKLHTDTILKSFKEQSEADPLISAFDNSTVILGEIASGVPVDKLSPYVLDPKYGEFKQRQLEGNIALAEIKFDLAEIEVSKSKLDVKEQELLDKVLAEALAEYPDDPQKQLDIIRDHKEKVQTQAAKAAAIRAGATLNDPSNQWEYVPWLLRNNPGMTMQEAEKLAAEKMRNEKSSRVSHNGLWNPNDPGTNPDPITNKLATNILDATNRQMDIWGPIQSADRGTINDIIETNKGYYKFRSVNPNTKLPINEAVVLGKNDEYLVTQVRIDSNGKTVSVLGSVKTTNEKLAKKLSPGIKPNEDGEYVIPNVMGAGDKADFGLKGLDTSDRTTSTATQSTATQGQPPYAAGPNQALENINGKWILINIPPK